MNEVQRSRQPRGATACGSSKRESTYPLLLHCLVFLTQLFQPVVFLLLEVGLFLHLGLVEAVDDGVLSLRNEYPLDLRKGVSIPARQTRQRWLKAYLARVLEGDLANLHAAILLEVHPGGVDYGDVIFLVA